MSSDFRPFPIKQFQTGQNTYLQPWIRPEDAFDPMVNAYVYRGSIYKRNGYIPLGTAGANAPGTAGHLIYRDFLASGNGGKTYSGTLTLIPIFPGTFGPTDGIESFTDNGSGTLTGSAGGTGTINYTTGAWSLSFNANVANGVDIYASFIPNLATVRPIMGLKLYTNETTDQSTLIALDTRRATRFDNASQSFLPITAVEQELWIGDGSSTSITINSNWSAVSPYTQILTHFSISITDGTSTITDNGSGGLSASGNFAAGGTVNYGTGVFTLNFTTAPATTVTITLTATLTGDYFTGNYSNFFNSTNWLNDLYLTNNKDPITLFNGTTLSRPPFAVTMAHQISFTNDIAFALDVKVYKNRLLVMRPTLVGAGGIPNAQRIYWSFINFPTNLVSDAAGNGGFLDAPTDDFLQCSEFLRDILVVFFTNSSWIFRFTNNDFDPFRFDKVNNSKSINAAYASISYDERCTAMGAKGLVACDGVNVQRYDIPIIDFFETINQNFFEQCFGIRFDTTNQSWMLYPLASSETTPPATQALIYNFAENTWAIFAPSVSMSCLGTYFVSGDATWASFAAGTPLGTTYPNWMSADFAWDDFLDLNLSPELLGGGSDGVVYLLGQGDSDNGTAFNCNITSKQWNPFIDTGEKVQFGYIDFYYVINETAVLELNFFLDNDESPTMTRFVTLDGEPNANKNMKRIYINSVGEFVRMTISVPLVPLPFTGSFQILGLVLWARPAGRLTP